jgi:glycosyltransferase involved in cell wall biosynthesis
MNICQAIISDGWGGAEAVVYELSDRLREKGESISIITNSELVMHFTKLHGVKLLDIGNLFPPKSGVPNLPTRIEHPLLLRKSFLLFNLYRDELLRYYRLDRLKKIISNFLISNKIQIVHTHMSLSTILINNLRLPIAVTASDHGEWNLKGMIPVHPLGKPLSKLRARKFNKALDKVDKLHLLSSFISRYYQDHKSIPKSKITVIPPAVNINDIRNSLGSPLKLKGEFNLFFPGGAKTTKGGDILVSALAKLKPSIPKIHLYIAHNVPLNHKIREIVRKEEIEQNVTFTGFLSKPDYLNLLASADIFILPSRIENISIAIIEAMAIGKPVIVTKRGGCSDAVKENTNGILIDPRPGDIVQAVLQLYKDKQLKLSLAKNNIRDVANFDSKHIAAQLIELYREVLGTSPRGGS